MATFKFAKKQRVKAKRWLDGGAPKGVGADVLGVIVARTPACDTFEGRNYYTVLFSQGGVYEVAEDDLCYDNALDDFADQIR